MVVQVFRFVQMKRRIWVVGVYVDCSISLSSIFFCNLCRFMRVRCQEDWLSWPQKGCAIQAILGPPHDPRNRCRFQGIQYPYVSGRVMAWNKPIFTHERFDCLSNRRCWREEDPPDIMIQLIKGCLNLILRLVIPTLPSVVGLIPHTDTLML